VWGVSTRRIPAALTRLALDHAALRRTPGLRFAKLLGTGDGRTFTLRDADPRHWALLAAWEDAASATRFERGATVTAWAARSTERLRVEMRPLASRGRWSRRCPFGAPRPVRFDGPVAAVTRARIAPRKALTFWRAVPAVSADLRDAPGLRLALGIGEAPVGVQGTFSLWQSTAALTGFAHRREPHVEVIRRTGQERWYAEELFARFAVLDVAGTFQGRTP
jgi:quinol monooxygenase YgiN